MMSRGYFICVIFQILVQLIARGQDTHYFPRLHPSSVTVYDIDRGMPISCLAELFADPRGRLFINPCSYQDIYQNLSFYQFDGNQSHIFTLETEDGKAGPFDWYLQGSTENGLLFGTNPGRKYAFLYDPESDWKKVYSFGEGDRIRAMIAGPDKTVLILAYGAKAFSLFRATQREKELLVRIPAPEKPVFDDLIPAFRLGDELWFIQSNKGFFRYSLSNKQLTHYDWLALPGGYFQEYPRYQDDRTSLAFTPAPAGKILFYINSFGGFFVFDPVSGQFERQPQLDAFKKPLNRYDNVFVRFFRDARENLLVDISWGGEEAVKPEGILTTGILWDQEGQFFDYSPIVNTITTGRYRRANEGFYQSRDFKKQVLIGTGGGLIAVDLKASLSIRTGLDGWASRAMGELDSNRVLLLSESGYKALLDLQTMKANILSNRSSMGHPLFAARNFAQLVTRGDELWYPTEKGQLACYSKSDQSFRYYEIGQLFDKFNFIRPGEIALANTQNEIFRYDLEQGALQPFLQNGAPLRIGGTVNEMIVDRNGLLWIASLDGLWRIDPQAGASQRLGKADGLAHDQFLCIHEAADGEFWLGTLGSGLQRYHPETGAMRILDRRIGLSNNTVAGILSDSEGDFWVSTFDGLTVVSKEGKVLFKLFEEEGLPHREFNRYSYLKTRDGHLLFGGVDGVALLDPIQVKANFAHQDALRIYLTDIRYHDRSRNEETHLTAGFNQLERIVLPAAHRYIKLDFGISDWISPEKHLYAYRLRHDGSAEGTEAIWTEIGPGSELLLNDLPAGSYTLLIKGTNAKGQVTEEPLAIPLHVQEFFYKTWWFYALCALPFLLGAFFWIRRLQTEQQRLEAEVAARTQQIRQDKELIEQQAAKLQSLDEVKSRFFTNISHEFRTPLTIISGMAGQVKTNPGQWLDKGMELIQRNSNQLLALINQILDLRKLESGALKVNLVRGNIIAYLHYIADSFFPIAQSKGIRIHFLSTLPELEMDYDPDKMLQILSNLLSNAVKYTPGPGDIYLQVDRHGGQLNVHVKDTGQGISPEALPYIFDQFYQVEDIASQKPQGSGVGLALAKELVKLLNGTIEAASMPGAGTTFTLSFPITRKAEARGEIVKPAPQRDLQPAAPVQKAPPVMEPTGAQNAYPVSGPADSAEKPTLLIVEDNPDVSLYLSACLEKDYQLLMAENGQEGIDRAIEQVPGLIVSDVMMPLKDGFELCDTLKNDERTSHIPIVLLTAKADFESKITGLRKGADAYLPKPFEQEELLVRLEQLLILRMKLQERYRNLAAAGPPSASEAPEMEDGFIQKLRQEVLVHLAEEDFGIVHLQRALGVSRTQLHNKIKALTGQSTTEFIRMIRLNKARELLQTTDLNVSEVGYEVGFGNPAYFSRIYAEAFGEAPRQTRR